MTNDKAKEPAKGKAEEKPAKADANAEKARASQRAEIEAIKKEDLSGQQLRMARKLAQRHGIEASSDLDAVRLLRKEGIDPFLNPAIKAPDDKAPNRATPNLPAKRLRSEVGKRGPVTDNQRAKAIMKIQRDLVRRRRKRLIQLMARLTFFVTLPTIIAGYYFYNVASHMYSAKSEFVVQSSENPIAPSAPSLFGGSLFGAEDSIGVQGYLTSMEAMVRLDETANFKAVFQSDNIDVIQRMDADASNEAAHKVFKKKILVGFDPTEGIIRMEVIAPSPETALKFSQDLLSFAEERIGGQTQRLRDDQVKGARELRDDAETNLRNAQQKVLNLQEERGVLSGELEITAQMAQISTLEGILQTRKLSLAEVNNNARPNKAKVDALEAQILELNKSITELRDKMTAAGENGASLARITSELEQAKAEVVLRQTLLAQSVTTLEAAVIEASRQTKYIAQNVRPVLPQEASYPKEFENTFLAFLIFAGLYLVISLTGSILREQVST